MEVDLNCSEMFRGIAVPPSKEQKRILAFCHIEKAAGTSLIHVLRRIFFLRYAAVRPLHSRETSHFTAADLRTILRCNPFIRAIGGHSVVPFGDVLQFPARLEFITQVRDPIARANSQFRFWINRNIDRSGPESFLRHQVSSNFQVKKIAGQENLDLAKQNIVDRFLVAGTTERFDEFLLLLAGKLGLPFRLVTYERKNIGRYPAEQDIPARFLDDLRERNRLDQELYDWINTELRSKYLSSYAGDFDKDLDAFRHLNHESSALDWRKAVDHLYRNAYLKPVSGLIRMANGLPFGGSYAIE